MKLPIVKVKPSNINPKFTVLFGKPKCGKTTLVSALENALIIDTDASEGTDSVECMSIKAKTVDDLREIAKAIKEANTTKGDYFYEYGIIDTATDLEDIILPLALHNYRQTPMGKSFGLNKKTGKYDYVDIRTLPNGSGYLYIREAYKSIINTFRPLFKYFILLGHTKDKTINRQGKELSENALDLSGKLERIITAQADALGYVYRDKNKTIINFNGGGDSIVEARPLHLRGKEIVIAESDENNNLTFFWDKIYLK
jgi:hypothetical protein